jgi:hypothetical protein
MKKTEEEQLIWEVETELWECGHINHPSLCRNEDCNNEITLNEVCPDICDDCFRKNQSEEEKLEWAVVWALEDTQKQYLIDMKTMSKSDFEAKYLSRESEENEGD